MNPSAKPEFVIDGERFSTLQEFYEEISKVLIPGAVWGRNLDAFNDILRGWADNSDNGIVIRWKNSERSRLQLGQTVFETVVEIIQDHGSNGREANDKVELILE